MIHKQDGLTEEFIMSKIYIIRDKKVMLDIDLAEMYGVETKYLNKAVFRNIKRFPEDYMFSITRKEYDSLRFQIGTLNRGQHTKYLPKVFTQEGIAMLSGILNCDNAIHVNLILIKVFWKLEDMFLTQKEIFKILRKLKIVY